MAGAVLFLGGKKVLQIMKGAKKPEKLFRGREITPCGEKQTPPFPVARTGWLLPRLSDKRVREQM